MLKKTDKVLILTLEERSLLTVMLKDNLESCKSGIKCECELNDSDFEFYIKLYNDRISLIKSIMKKLCL